MHHRYRLLLAAMVASPIPVDRAAQAETRELDAAGTGLAVVEACARQVAITVDPALSGRIVATAEAGHAEEIAQIAADTVDGQAHVGLRTGLRQCWTPTPPARFDRTLILRIRVPAGFPVSVREEGLGEYDLGAVGPLAVSAYGMMRLRADAVVGDARIDASGAIAIAIDRLDANRLHVGLSGSGSLQVRDGRIGTVSVSDSGTAAVRIDPVVDSADLSSSGLGGISLGGVRGSLRRASSGPGRITVAGRPPTERRQDGN